MASYQQGCARMVSPMTFGPINTVLLAAICAREKEDSVCYANAAFVHLHSGIQERGTF
jgi:hypothetical protein